MKRELSDFLVAPIWQPGLLSTIAKRYHERYFYHLFINLQRQKLLPGKFRFYEIFMDAIFFQIRSRVAICHIALLENI
jgi:hypothetical protein